MLLLLIIIINHNVTKVYYSIFWTAPDKGLKCYKEMGFTF